MYSSKQNAPNQNVNNAYVLFGYDPSSPPPYRSQIDGVPRYYSQFQIPQQFHFQYQPHTQLSQTQFPSQPPFTPSTEHVEHEEQQQQPQQQKKGKVDPRRWIQKEEVELAREWFDISEDGGTGKGQTRDQFWLHITKRFCRGMGRNPDYRTSDQCNSKWNLMNKFVTHCNGIYTNFEKHWASRESDASLLKKTHATFQDDMQKSFKFINVWEVVKRSIRWRELATHEEIANPPKRSRTSSYSSSQQVSSDGHVGVNLNDDNDDIE
ncbi:unnamed protein product [Lactuca virosa]|uniref:Myb-like domain-containing protein n=1 Tax=Lactuca virosa TaxID=75947 RepID=A0AAU9NUC9_9ASTR|nr:unnamed protein product [Lactuca virosa]